MTDAPKPGTIGWIDLTVEDAESVRAFYKAVAGWSADPVDMGGYSDFNMKPSADGAPVAGVCHARGSNADIPPVWMIYIVVADLDGDRVEGLALGHLLLIAASPAVRPAIASSAGTSPATRLAPRGLPPRQRERVAKGPAEPGQRASQLALEV